jgi:hypothetical protein
MKDRSWEIRRLLSVLEVRDVGEAWPPSEIQRGWVEDIGDLLVSLDAKKNVHNPDVEALNVSVENDLADSLWSAFVLTQRYNITLDELSLASLPFPPHDTMAPEQRLVVCVGKVGKSMQSLDGLRAMEEPKQVLVQSLAGAISCVDKIAQREGISLENAFHHKMEILETKLNARLRTW